jgi:hypothetical protein
MSRAERKLYRELGHNARLDRERAIDAERADLPWYMQRDMRAVLARLLRRTAPPRP